MAIKFGTDGWRAIIAEDYTFDNVRICAQGTADYLKGLGTASSLLIGYDTRYASDRFAAAVAEVAAGNGIRAVVCSKPCPTPVTSFNVVHGKLTGAVMITASHNPPAWNGFKYKPDYGGSASQDVVDALEKKIASVEAGGPVSRKSLGDAKAEGFLSYIDPMPPYLEHLERLVDLKAIRNSGVSIVTDPMYGSGSGYLRKILSGGSTRVTQINSSLNPSFPGIGQPEPVAHNLKKLSSLVAHRGANVGIATDGDADRVGIVDEKGRFLTTLQTFALLCLYLLEVRKERGALVRSLTMTTMIDLLGEIYGVPTFSTAVGFKYLGPVMRKENALAAGEESGGYAFRGHIPERDGVLSGLYFIDMMVKTGKTASELVDYLYSKVGPHHYDRLDMDFEPLRRNAILEKVAKSRPDSLAGKRVKEIDTRDGYRFVFDGGYWMLIRFSGTEPLIRIYAEAESMEDVKKLLEEGRGLAGL